VRPPPAVRSWQEPHKLLWAWGLVSGLLVAGAAALAWVSPRFAYEIEVIETPAAAFGVGLALASLVWLAIVPLVRASERQDVTSQRAALTAILVTGLLMRAFAAASTPILEDDWYRYLWEGGLWANGLSPYAIAPADAAEVLDPAVNGLAESAGQILARVNHPHLKTIYPPVAQTAFAIAHLIEPWSFAAWRAVSLLLDLSIALVLLGILDALGRSRLWVALYWLNPVVVKELVNTAHMEGVLMLPVVGALLLALRGRHVAATLVMGLAVGAKVWPLLLLPLILRPLLGDWSRLALALVLLALLGAGIAWPIIVGGLDETSGFLAYAEHWQSNSALFPALQFIMAQWIGLLGLTEEALASLASRLARAAMGGFALLIALALSLRPIAGPRDLTHRMSMIVFAIVLLSPAQFPWYMVWMIPFLAIMPIPGLLVAVVTTPLYYTYFHYSSRDLGDLFRTRMVWVIWLPVWLVLLADAWRAWRNRAIDSASSEPTPHA